MNSSLAINHETIGGILKMKSARVPINQRSYRWDKEHIQDLYQDMNGEIQNKRDEYFLGAVVAVKSQSATYIFDGQQRIATTMVLIAAIRDYFLENSDNQSADDTERDFLISRQRGSSDQLPHFKLNTKDHSFFFDRVLLRSDNPKRKKVEPQRSSHKRIEMAAKFSREFVKNITLGLSASSANARLHDWLNFIESSLRVIWVEVGDERTAFTIFETMNDRGLKLSAADLLKNYLYAIAGDSDRDTVATKWEAMCGVLETIEGEAENVVAYIRCYWITQYGHTRTRELYDQIKDKAPSKSKAMELVSELELVSQDYAAILLSDHEKLASRGENVKTKIEVLRSLGVSQIRPVLLAAFSTFSPKEFDKLLDACVSWSVRSLICGVPSGTLEDYYSRVAVGITKKTYKKASEVKGYMAPIIPNNKKFEIAVATANVSEQHLARYYLRALQRCADGEKEPQYIVNPSADVTLEHILPARPGNDWNHFSPEDQRAYLKRLGNQVLLSASVNSKIGNASYDIKKTALQASPFSLTKDAATYQKWDKDQINLRQENLAKLAVKTWPLI